MVKGYYENIEEETLKNDNFRKVLYTSKNIQVVAMCLKPGQEIGLEIHPENDQFFRFEEGTGKCLVNENSYGVEDGSAIVVPKGFEHNVVNTSEDKDLKFYTIYSPPHHKDKLVHKTKEEAESNEQDFDGVYSESLD